MHRSQDVDSEPEAPSPGGAAVDSDVDEDIDRVDESLKEPSVGLNPLLTQPDDSMPDSEDGDHPYAYPNRSSWPEWITEAIDMLDSMSNMPKWKECISEWLLMEHRLGYPIGMVREHPLSW